MLNFGAWRMPEVRILDETEIGNSASVRRVRLVTLEVGFGVALDPKRIDDGNMMAFFLHLFGHRLAVYSGRLETGVNFGNTK